MQTSLVGNLQTRREKIDMSGFFADRLYCLAMLAGLMVAIFAWLLVS